MLRTRKLHMGMCVGALICIVAVLWAVPSSANTARTTETPPSPLELWGPDQPQGEGSSSTLDFLVVQESGPAVATCRVEIDLEAGMNKVVVQGVPSTVDCGAVELLSGTVPFKVASAAMDRGSGQLVLMWRLKLQPMPFLLPCIPFLGSHGAHPTMPHSKSRRKLRRFGHGIPFGMRQTATLRPQSSFL